MTAFLLTPNLKLSFTSTHPSTPKACRRFKRCTPRAPSAHLGSNNARWGVRDDVNDPLFVDADSNIVAPSYAFEGALESSSDIALDPSGGGGAGGRADGSGGSGRDDENDDDLPDDLRQALAIGAVQREAVQRYRSFLRIPLLGALIHIASFRSRLLADSTFFFKVLVQEVIGNGTALASEIAVRGKDTWDELEYVASDLIVGTVVEAAFVWILAPTLPKPPGGGRIATFLNLLPANAFAKAPSATVPLRIASFVYGGLQYMVVGLAGGIVGTAITYGLIEGRKKLDKSYQPKRPLPDVLPNSLAWGTFMALSSNTRFQIVEGMERGIAVVCGGVQKPAVNAGIVTLRFANNYWGGVQFVQFFRWLGLHATEDEAHEE